MATHSSILAWRIPMDRGAWQAIVHGAAKSQTQQNKYKDATGFFSLHKDMAVSVPYFHFLLSYNQHVLFACALETGLDLTSVQSSNLKPEFKPQWFPWLKFGSSNSAYLGSILVKELDLTCLN